MGRGGGKKINFCEVPRLTTKRNTLLTILNQSLLLRADLLLLCGRGSQRV